MKKQLLKLAGFLIDEPGKIWVYGVIPFFGFVAMLCLLSGNFSIFTTDQIGYRLFRHEQFDLAADRFGDPLWKAAALYRKGEFKEAGAIYSGFDSPEGVYNHANSLVMLGKYEEAVRRYQRALALKPGWGAAEANMKVAIARAERVKKEGGEMTGGQLAADDFVFSDSTASSDQTEEVVEAGQQMSDAEMRAVWLRNVQTEPADFLRSKFAYQQAMGASVNKSAGSPKN